MHIHISEGQMQHAATDLKQFDKLLTAVGNTSEDSLQSRPGVYLHHSAYNVQAVTR